ncbi:hypothetical protein ASD15_01050 [Massilia sp. Root351]|uniref:hypothetical protein n=1 Tax=Massilia sp. Root351 TaxID=1736522 RepID=UPI00070C627E|nr:hypothetical protein [Massilia sp. Root351]KQV90698.1 hypothetical protein ASD15_01050 [Massilia sp. Root351]
MKTPIRVTTLAPLALALLLGGCGGSGGGTPAAPVVAPPPPVTMADAFYSAVLALIGASPEDKEPAAIDGVAVTTPENSEPAE